MFASVVVEEGPFAGSPDGPWAPLDEVPGGPPAPQARLSELGASGWAAWELDWATGRAAGMADGEVLDGIVGLDRVISWAQARQARLLAEFAVRRGDTPEAFNEDKPSVMSRYAPDEVGVALRLSRGEAMGRLNHARYLAERTPAVLDAWESGELDGAKVRTITDAVAFLGRDTAAAVVERVMPGAPQHSRGQLRAVLAKAVIAADPEGANVRHRQARTDRRVSVYAQPEGMASLWAYLSAPDARSCWEWLTRLARGLGKEDARGMDARRADLLVALLSGKITLDDGVDPADAPFADQTGDQSAAPTGAGAAPDPGRAAPTSDDSDPARPARERLAPVTPGKPLVTVVVPHETLAGAGEQPGELAGYGPIPAELAREIAADSVWRRLVSDPLSGTVLDYGRTTYHPPVGLADWVRARDLHCRGPRCPRPAAACELDHHIAYPDGPTSESNLDDYCKIHHDLKHHAGWRVTALPDGGLEWITPTGYRHVTRPHDYRPDPLDLESGLPEPQPPPPPDPDDDEPPF